MEGRKLFKFYKSYYDVMCELPENKQLEFLKAIFEKEFFNIEPQLNGILKLAYVSQKHSIDAQVKGFIDKTNIELTPPIVPPIVPPTLQLKVEVKEKVKEKEEIYKSFAHLSISVLDFDKLVESGYSKTQIDNVLESIENYKKNVSYKSLYLTAKKWLAKEPKEIKVETILIPNTEW